MKAFTFATILLFIYPVFSQNISPPAYCLAVIGSPANGISHYLDINWAKVNGATSYQAQYSPDSITWDSLYTGTMLITSHNTGSQGNLPFYYRVRAYQGSGASNWTYATPYPIYSACNDPGLPVLLNAGYNAITISLPPDNNAPGTTYSIFCVTDSLYLQSNGSLAGTEMYQTSSAWGTATVSNLLPNLNYCFFAKARNGNGDVRVARGTAISIFEPWSINVLDTTVANPTNTWWSPDTSVWSPLQYFPTGGCSNGNVGFQGAYNNYWRSFLRSPAVNCTGLNQATFQFDIINSFFPSHPNDGVNFTMWAPTPGYPQGTFSNALTVNGKTGFSLPFDSVRNCETITVVYDLVNITDKSAVFFYLNPYCGYNDADIYNVRFTNTSIGAGGLSSACIATTILPVVNEAETPLIKIFPNPFSDHLTLNLSGSCQGCSIRIYDASGRKLEQYELPKNENNFDIKTSALPVGLYILNIVSPGGIMRTERLLKTE